MPVIHPCVTLKQVLLTVVIITILPAVSFAKNKLLEQGMEMLNSGNSQPVSGASSTNAAGRSSLSQGEMGDGLKEALRIGTDTVVSKLGKTDGFNSDKNIHIPLPGQLGTVQKALKAAGYSSLVDDLELKLNRAAEQATPKAKQLFLDAIAAMTIQDAAKILNGPEDSATQYFRKAMGPGLSKEMRPVVATTLAEAGAVQAYDKMIGQYQTIPMVPDAKANLSEYVVEKGLDGIFHYVAVEEASIRNNPGKRTTALLQKVFGK